LQIFLDPLALVSILPAQQAGTCQSAGGSDLGGLPAGRQA